MSAAATDTTELEKLHDLNLDYIAAVQGGNVRRFEEILGAEFYCSNPDGSLVDRRGFLAQTAKPVMVSALRAHDVLIRRFGDLAIIHARTTYSLPDGQQANGRYTDVWVRQSGTWKAVSAHVTRC